MRLGSSGPAVKRGACAAILALALSAAVDRDTMLDARSQTSPPAAAGDMVRFASNTMVAMRDGVRLATDIYRPAVNGVPVETKLPVLLQRTPYNKEGAALVAQAQAFARHGYVVALQDERGAFHSEGVQSKYIGYGEDGFDTIEWLAKQPYADGRVAMWGTSYAAHAEAGAAILRPPHLATAVLNMGGLYNGWLYKVRNHGAFELAQQTTWVFGQLETEEKAKTWIRDIAATRGKNPLSAEPSFEDYYYEILTHADYDDYWKHPDRNWSTHYEQTSDIPMLHLTGWYDSYTSGSILNYVSLRKAKRAPERLIVGPWTHGGNTRSFAGNVEFGPEAKIADFNEAFHLRWFDHYLKGQATGVEREPEVKLFVMGTGDGHKDANGRLFHGGYWKSATAWPPPDAVATTYYLHADRTLGTARPGDAAPTTYVYDPATPVPTIGGAFSGTEDMSPAGAFDQRETAKVFGATSPGRALSDRPDVVTFQTPPLTKDTEVIGAVTVRLFVSSSAKDTDFTAKLIDVYPPSADYPGGYAMNLTDGIVRARYRDALNKALLLTPGQIVEVDVEPFPTANVFKRGHRIRVDISSSNFPRFDINPNTGEPLGRHTKLQTAENRIYHDAAHPSAIVLSVMPRVGAPSAAQAPAAASAPPAKVPYADKVVSVNGLKIHYLDWGHPERPPFLMLHGIARHAHTFDHLAAAFADRYHVMAIDMRGHGDSSWSPEGAYLVEDYVSDLEGVVAQLKLRHLTLLGNSTGGRVVQVFAGLHPDLVDRLVVEDVGPERPQEIADGFARRVKEEANGWASEDELLTQLATRDTRTPRQLQWNYVHYGLKRRDDGRMIWKRDPNLVKGFVVTELWSAVSKITAPTIYVLGGASAIVTPEAQQKLKQTLPRVTVVTMPGLGHYPDSDDPPGFLAIVEKFLSQKTY